MEEYNTKLRESRYTYLAMMFSMCLALSFFITLLVKEYLLETSRWLSFLFIWPVLLVGYMDVDYEVKNYIAGSLEIAYFFGIALFFVNKYYYANKRGINSYFTCPNKSCDKSLRLWEDWFCPKCDRTQGEQRPIDMPCKRCKKSLAHVYCEYCDSKLVL